jgi:hypothetical protein
MSALLKHQQDIVSQSIEVNQTLELRQIPHLRRTATSFPPLPGPPGLNLEGNDEARIDHVQTILEDILADPVTSWLYSGATQLIMKESRAPWTHSGWNFVPIELSQVRSANAKLGMEYTVEDSTVKSYSTLNVTVVTPAIKGRIECSPIEELKNESSWLEPWVNSTSQLRPDEIVAGEMSGSSTIPISTETGATQLRELPTQLSPDPYSTNLPDSLLRRNSTHSEELSVLSPTMFPGTKHSTTNIQEGDTLRCCGNQTEQDEEKHSSYVAVGYWTANFGSRNFTSKWIHGLARIMESFTDYESMSRGDHIDELVFEETPRIQALNCVPVIETSEAKITLEQHTGQVIQYEMLKKPQPVEIAWSDRFVVHENSTGPAYDPESYNCTFMEVQESCERKGFSRSYKRNVTIRYVIIFIDSSFQQDCSSH